MITGLKLLTLMKQTGNFPPIEQVITITRYHYHDDLGNILDPADRWTSSLKRRSRWLDNQRRIQLIGTIRETSTTELHVRSAWGIWLRTRHEFSNSTRMEDGKPVYGPTLATGSYEDAFFKPMPKQFHNDELEGRSAVKTYEVDILPFPERPEHITTIRLTRNVLDACLLPYGSCPTGHKGLWGIPKESSLILTSNGGRRTLDVGSSIQFILHNDDRVLAKGIITELLTKAQAELELGGKMCSGVNDFWFRWKDKES